MSVFKLQLILSVQEYQVSRKRMWMFVLVNFVNICIHKSVVILQSAVWELGYLLIKPGQNIYLYLKKIVNKRTLLKLNVF